MAPLWKPSIPALGGAMALAALMLFRRRRDRTPDFREKCLLAAFWAYPVSALPQLVQDFGDTFRGMDSPSKFLAAGLVYYALASRKVSIPIPKLLSALSLGAIFSAVFMFYQCFVRQVERASGGVGIIQFSDIAGISCVLCLAGFLGHSGKRGFSVWMACGALCAASAVLFARTRINWIATLCAGAAAVALLWPLLRKNPAQRLRLGMTMAALILIAAGTFSIPFTRNIVRNRIAAAIAELSAYTAGAENATSVGTRIDLWRMSWRHFRESPVIGLGFRHRAAFNERLIEENYIRTSQHRYGTMHNELLNALSTKGLIGASAILALYAAPLALFLGRRRDARDARQALPAVLGIATVIYYGIAGLAGEPLYVSVTSTYLAFLLAALASAAPEIETGPELVGNEPGHASRVA